MINQNWVFGSNCGLNFDTTPPTPFISNLKGEFPWEGCASISDSSGKLLFYTDGISIWDGTHHVIPLEGDLKLKGDPSSTQSAIIVPVPKSDYEYYIFTIDGSTSLIEPDGPFDHFNGIRVNVNTWELTPITNYMIKPLGKLPNTKGFSPAEKLTAIQHRNGRDFWVITILQDVPGAQEDEENPDVKNGKGTFRIFLVDSKGIKHVCDAPMNQLIHEEGYLRVSSNGKRIAIANGANKNVLVYPFDKVNGSVDIEGLIKIDVPENKNAYGVEFSPNSNILYFSHPALGKKGGQLLEGKLYQVDLMSTPIAANTLASFENKGVKEPYWAIGALQAGIDGVIYIAKPGERSLAAITAPNNPGLEANVVQDYIKLPRKMMSGLGLPNLLPNPCLCELNPLDRIILHVKKRKAYC